MKGWEILIYIGVFIVWNIVVFFVYGLDKYAAIHRIRRIREDTLLLISFFGGGVGGLFGMCVFNHKTRKWKFRILQPLMAVVTVIGYFMIGRLFTGG